MRAVAHGRRNKSLRTFLDFIPFPLYSMLNSLSDAFFLSFFSVSKGDNG